MGKTKRCDTVDHGTIFKPKGEEQIAFIDSMKENYLTVCRSKQFGNGKTYCAVGHSSKLLKNDDIQKIIFCRDSSVISKRMGFNPGTRLQKLSDSIRFAINYYKYFLGDMYYKLAPRIEYRDVSELGGETFTDSFMILDEAADCTSEDITMFISRAGFGTRCAVLGTDRQSSRNNCFGELFTKLYGVPNVGLIELKQIMRNDWLGPVLDAIDKPIMNGHGIRNGSKNGFHLYH